MSLLSLKGRRTQWRASVVLYSLAFRLAESLPGIIYLGFSISAVQPATKVRGGGSVRGKGVDKKTAIGRDSVLSGDKVRTNNPCLKKHVRGTCRFCSRIKVHHHQFPIERYIKQMPAVMGPVGLRAATAGDTDWSSRTRKRRDEDCVGIRHSQFLPNVGDPFAIR